MSEPFIAEIRIFGFNFPPRGWAFCNGQLVNLSQNTALFALVGTNYGGDGRTTFALPDLQGRAPLQWGHGPGLTNRPIGVKSGAEDVTLTTGQMPSHTHQMRSNSGNANSQSPVNNFLATELGPGQYYAAASNLQPMGANAVGNTGGSAPHNNMQPFLTMNFCIALTGIFPSRN